MDLLKPHILPPASVYVNILVLIRREVSLSRGNER